MSTVKVSFFFTDNDPTAASTPSIKSSYPSNAMIDDVVKSCAASDLCATAIRYSRFSRDEELVQGHVPDTNGYLIDFASLHHWFTWLIYAGAGALTVLFISHYSQDRKSRIEEEEKKAVASYNLIAQKLKKYTEDKRSDSKQKNITIEGLNRCFQEMIGAGKTIYDKGSEIKESKITKSDGSDQKEITFSLKKKPTWSLINLIFPIWAALEAYAVFFWLEWLWWGLYKTSILSLGFLSTVGIVAYVLPALPSIVYLSYKLYHWYGSRFKAERDGTTQDIAEIAKLQPELERALEIENQKARLDLKDEDITYSQLPAAQGISFTNYVDACVNGLVAAVGAYGLSHYILWPLSELFPVLASSLVCLNIFSVGIFFLGIGYGIWSAKNRADELAENQINNEALKTLLSQKRSGFLVEIGSSLDPQLNPITPSSSPQPTAPNSKMRYIRYLGDLLMLGMSGGFLARLFVFTKTSLFLPSFINFTAGAALLTGLWPYAIVMAATVLWGGFRLCLLQQKKKELAGAAELQSKKNERAALIHAIKIADIQLANQQKRDNQKASVEKQTNSNLSVENPSCFFSKSPRSVFTSDYHNNQELASDSTNKTRPAVCCNIL